MLITMLKYRISNEAEAIRTPNLRIDSPMYESRKPIAGKDLRDTKKRAYKPAYKKHPQTPPDSPQDLPGELAEIVAVWPTLPEHIKAAIRALVQTTIQGESQ